MADICSRSRGETGSDGEEEGGTVGRGEGAKRRPDVAQTENTERVIVGRGWGVIPVLGHVTPYFLHANLVLFFSFVLFFITDMIPAQETGHFIRKNAQYFQLNCVLPQIASQPITWLISCCDFHQIANMSEEGPQKNPVVGGGQRSE